MIFSQDIHIKHIGSISSNIHSRSKYLCENVQSRYEYSWKDIIYIGTLSKDLNILIKYFAGSDYPY